MSGSGEYISREAAIEAICEDCFMHKMNQCKAKTKEMYCSDYQRIMDIPAADVRPVVRCKNCRHRDPEDHKCDSGEMERQGCPFPVHDDYFCAYGEE